MTNGGSTSQPSQADCAESDPIDMEQDNPNGGVQEWQSYDRSESLGRDRMIGPGHSEQRALLIALKPFQTASLPRSLWQFGSTVLAYLVLNALMYAALQISFWITLVLAVPTAGLVVRVFIIQHDCGHGAFFRSRWANDWLGRVCSPITFTPYAFWRRQHANHHACFNNLDHRDSGIDLYSTCATLEEYRAKPWLGRVLYRTSRHPLVSQVLLPPLVFLIVYRVPFDTSASWLRERRSVWLTNVAIAITLGALLLVFGPGAVLLVQLPTMVLASIVGVWLFCVQHRFEAAQWACHEQWTLVHAALKGSSYLKLPRVLQWFTGNIGFHHVHHLSARVPNYRLQECHEARPELDTVTILTFRQALLAPSFALWDENAGHMVRFPKLLPGRAKRTHPMQTV